MKKKILAFIIAVFLITPCLKFNAAATITERDDNSTACGISLSEDYKTLYYNGKEYKRFDASMTEWSYENEFYGIKYDSDEIKSVDFQISVNTVIITAEITLSDGSNISATYINADEYLTEHNVLTIYPSTYTVEFGYPNDNQIQLNSNQILGEKITFSGYDLSFYECFDVNAYATNNNFYIKKGIILLNDDTYYYVDYGANDVTDPYDFYPESHEFLCANKITDAEAIAVLEEAYSLYNSDAIGILMGDFSGKIGAVLFSLVFGLIPFAALIVFLILSLRAKLSTYKKMFRTIWILSLAEVVAFVITVIVL